MCFFCCSRTVLGNKKHSMNFHKHINIYIYKHYIIYTLYILYYLLIHVLLSETNKKNCMSVLPFFWVPSFFVAQKKHRSLHRRPTASLVLLFQRKLLTSKQNGAKTPGKVVANHHGPPPSCNFSIFVFSHVHPFQVSSIPTCPNPPKQQKSILNQVAQQNPPSDCVSNPFFCEPPVFCFFGRWNRLWLCLWRWRFRCNHLCLCLQSWSKNSWFNLSKMRLVS